MENNLVNLSISDKTFLIEPKTYLQLIQKVGNKGPYQRNVFLIFFLNWFVASLLLMGTSFLFLNPELNCSSQGISPENCQSYVCSLPQNQRSKFYEQQSVISLATQFGPFHCEKSLQLDALRMTLYVGTFFGYIGVLFITDNYGRKFSIIISWGITILGIAILSAAVDIWMACVGLFLAGVGCQSTIRITMAVLSQITQNILRQKYSVALEISFGLGQITIGLVYWLISDWRWITIGFCFIPAIITFTFLLFYVEQTPKFAIKNSIQKGIKSLNRIGYINLNQSDIINQRDVTRVLQNHVKDPRMRTPIDLCRYKSQRGNFIAMSIVFFSMTYLYFGPSIIVGNLGLNIFVTQIVLGVSQTIAYPVCFLFIDRSPRKLNGYVFCGISVILFVALVFVKPPLGCNFCFLGILQLIIVFIVRFCICYYFSILFLFITQLFPLPLRGIGFGTCSALGAVASSSGQFVLTALQQVNFDPMILFAIFSSISIVGIYFLPQTHKRPLAEQIPQEAQQQIAQKYKNIQEVSTQRNRTQELQIEKLKDCID